MTSRARFKFDHFLLAGMLAVLAASALAGGVVTPWAQAGLALSILTLALLVVGKGLKDRSLKIVVPPFTWPLLAALGVAILQSLTWTDTAGVRQSLSLDVEATRGVLFLLVLLLLWLWLGATIFRTTKSLNTLIKFLVVFGLILAFSALVLSLAWQQNFTWLRPVEGGSPFGTFVNRNHFAGYMELLLPLPVALLVTHRATLENRVFYVFVAVMMGLALCFSLSRGGLISLCAQMIFLVSLNAQMRIAAQQTTARLRLLRWGGVGAVALLIIVGVIAMGADPIVFRIAGSDFETDRGAIWADSWRIFQAHPLMGAGLGAFATSFPQHAPDSGFNIAGEAHNDYLQVLTDAGLIGGVILLWFLFLLVRVISQSMKTGAPQQAALALGCATGLFGLLVHSLFDFNLQLLSHALLFLLFTAVCSNLALAVKQTSLIPIPQEIVTKTHRPTPIFQ